MISSSATDREHGLLRLEVIPLQQPHEAVILPVSAFPMPEHESRLVGRFLERLSAVVAAQWGLAAEVFIHMAHLQHKDGSASRFSSQGKNWLPKLGLGVWPDRPAPTIWTKDDFFHLVPGERLRTLRNHVFQISRSPEAREDARRSMLGWGSVIQIMTSGGEQIFFQRSRELLLPPITDPCFNCFPFYVPLMERKSLTSVEPKTLESWFCGGYVYIRESAEDLGVLIASRHALRPALTALGAEPEDDYEKAWTILI
jgi:hypothetical protein